MDAWYKRAELTACFEPLKRNWTSGCNAWSECVRKTPNGRGGGAANLDGSMRPFHWDKTTKNITVTTQQMTTAGHNQPTPGESYPEATTKDRPTELDGSQRTERTTVLSPTFWLVVYDRYVAVVNAMTLPNQDIK